MPLKSIPLRWLRNRSRYEPKLTRGNSTDFLYPFLPNDPNKFLSLSLSLSFFYNLKNQYKKRDIGFQASRLANRQKTYVASNFGTIKPACFCK